MAWKRAGGRRKTGRICLLAAGARSGCRERIRPAAGDEFRLGFQESCGVGLGAVGGCVPGFWGGGFLAWILGFLGAGVSLRQADKAEFWGLEFGRFLSRRRAF